MGRWGRGREECRCDNEGRQWTGQSAQSKWQAADVATEQAVTFCLYSPPSILALSTPLGLLLHSNHKTIFYAIHVCIYVMQSERKKFHSIVQLQKLIKCDITDKIGCLCHFCQHEVILKMTKYSALCRQTAVSCMHALLTHVVLNNTRTYSSQSGDCCWLKSVPQEYNNDVTILLLSHHLGEPTVG